MQKEFLAASPVPPFKQVIIVNIYGMWVYLFALAPT